jgi:hypothetical protein
LRSDVAQVTFRTTGRMVDSRVTMTVDFSIRAMMEELIKCTGTVTPVTPNWPERVLIYRYPSCDARRVTRIVAPMTFRRILTNCGLAS